MPGSSRVELVQLTGPPRVVSGTGVLPFVPDKRHQLLAYLAYQGDWTGRERVATLFWPDTDTANSKQNLRALLQRVKTVAWSNDLTVTPHQLKWTPDTDVARYRAALRDGREQEAIDAYSGPLLAGLESDDDGEFSEWLQIERDKLHGDWRGIALAGIRAAAPHEAHRAAELLRRLLDADALDEEAVRVYLGAMARAGRIEEGRAAYQAFAARLADEMGLEPTSETIRAVEDLDNVVVTQVTAPAPAPTVPVGDTLPTLATTFVGRLQELGDIGERLRDPACRVLSIVGPGGVGKTRLALRAARDSISDFEAVTFVPLDSLDSPDEVPTAIAGALGVPLAAGVPPLQQVTRALKGRRTLLLLDNFEHVTEAAPAVLALLDADPGVKVLITSRLRLGIEAEWLYPLEGFAFPSRPVTAQAALNYPAIELFVERARRVRPKFSPEPEQVALIARLCERLDGLPLAIELAAAWVRALPLAAIVEGVEENLDLLETSDRDAIPRHRSVRATFEQSWGLLSEAEQGLMRRLSVFKGPVSAPAASFVAGASHVVLAALVDKSLLRLGSDGRYDRHPLLLAFAAEKLAEAPGEKEAAEARHAAYYRRFLRERTDKARGPRPAPTLSEIDGELPEILAAARWARAHSDSRHLVDIMRLLEIDTGYLRARGYGVETVELLEAAASAATDASWWESAHDLTGRLGDVYANYRGESQRGLAAYREAADLARRGGNVVREAIFLSSLGSLRMMLDGSAWPSELDEALELARNSEDDLCLAAVLEQRAAVLGKAGDLAGSASLARESLAAVDRLAELQAIEPHELYRRRFFATMSLGEIEKLQGRLDASKHLRLEALAIAEASGNHFWRALALHMLGELLGRRGEHEAARGHLAEARTIYEENQVSSMTERLDSHLRELGYEDLVANEIA